MRNLAKHCIIKNCKKPAYAKKLCRNHYSKEWVKKNPAKYQLIKKRYYERNRSDVLKKVEEYQEKNYRKIQKRKREYYLKNRSRILELKRDRYHESKKTKR